MKIRVISMESRNINVYSEALFSMVFLAGHPVLHHRTRMVTHRGLVTCAVATSNPGRDVIDSMPRMPLIIWSFSMSR